MISPLTLSLSLSTDTAFMFIIGGFLIVRVIQYRYPMFNSEAAIAFLSFGVIILFTLLGIVSVEVISCDYLRMSCDILQYYDWRKPMPVRVALFIIVILLIFVFFISYYRFHQWSELDTISSKSCDRLIYIYCRL